MTFKHIQTEMKDGVATLTLNRAPLNILNIEMMEEINTYLEGLKKEKSLKLLRHPGRGQGLLRRVWMWENISAIWHIK